MEDRAPSNISSSQGLGTSIKGVDSNQDPGDERRSFSSGFTAKKQSTARSTRVSSNGRVTTSSTPGSQEFQQVAPVDMPAAPRRKWYVRWSHHIVEHRYTVAATTILTVYVLCGEDLKLLCTNKPADLAFGILGIICLAAFSIELGLSCIGKDDYFLGFFFSLDLISTLSLILDLPWVSDLMHNDDDSGVNTAAKGRTARIGAKAARVVRVIRLVRIVKLYKAAYEATQKYKRNHADDDGKKPGEDEEDEDENIRESRVGRKLSDLTTRRVIVLVLSMLIVLPMLAADETGKFAESASYGADEVWLAYEGMVSGHVPRLHYERAILRYIFYHNWYSGNHGCPEGKDSSLCPAEYYGNLFWVGFTSADESVAAARAADAQIRESTVDSYVELVKRQDEIYNFGTMPSEALAFLSSEWKSGSMMNDQYKYGVSLIQTEITDYVNFAAPNYQDLRPQERVRFYPRQTTFDEFTSYHFEFGFDQRPFVRTESAYSLGTTCFVCIVLCSAAMMFYNDVNRLVLFPVEAMISKVEKIRDNPLMAVTMAEDQLAKEVLKKKNDNIRTSRNSAHSEDGLADAPVAPEPKLTTRVAAQAKRCASVVTCEQEAPAEPMETRILETTIIKLGSLLALGFGEAGAHIINANMQGTTTAGVNAMIPGHRVECIIGHARIQNFSVATEVLKGKVFKFVNQVAEIVHGVVNALHGAANKNNGDTFLIVWRYDQEMEDFVVSKLADMSILAFSKVIGAIHRSPVLASYRGHPGLQQKLGSQYRVRLSCGLHEGWAIEGAVGSEYKIEASYLSPNVAVAVNVEEVTSTYGVSLLATESCVKKCSPGMNAKCRLIDHVFIPGSKDALELYSVDLDWRAVSIETDPSACKKWTSRARLKARQFLEAEKTDKWNQEICALFDEDPDISVMRSSCTEEFSEIFRMGYQNYVCGEWQVARRFLSHTSVMLGPIDGPSWALIKFMEDPYQFEAPPGWVGIHDLSPGRAPGRTVVEDAIPNEDKPVSRAADNPLPQQLADLTTSL